MASEDLKNAEELLKLAASNEGRPSFMMNLSQGKFDSSLLFGFEVEDVNKNNNFGELSAWLNNYLNNEVDPVQILRNSKVPKNVFDRLSQLLLGAKIKKEYGGLELSTLQYCHLMRTLSSQSAALGIWYTANCSIGLSGYLMVVYSSLKKELKEKRYSFLSSQLRAQKQEELEALIAKTEWQMKEFLPKLAAGANAGFGLTQVEAGSDPMAMIGTGTVAERTPDGMFHVRGHKLYNTNGTIAEFEVIMAPLAPGNSICSFIVPTSGYGEFKAIPLQFAGNRGIENALILFDVKVPETFLIGRETGHDGFKNALRTLNVGRLAMAAGSSATIVNCLQISRWWCKERVQQKLPVGKYKVNGIKVAKMACDAFAVEAIMNLGSAMYDKHKLGIDLRLETAAVKLWSTEKALVATLAHSEIRSGAGYETYESQVLRFGLTNPSTLPLPDENFINDARVLKIGEGTSDIQRLIISGMMFAPHAFRLLPILDLKHPFKAVKAVVTALVYYLFWIPSRIALMFWHGLFFWNYIGYIKYSSNKLALKSLWLMIWHGAKLLREQVETGYIADQLTELWVMSAVRWYANKLRSKHGPVVDEIADVHCGYAKCRIRGDAENKPHGSLDKMAYKLGQKIIFEDATVFLEKGVASVLDRERKRWGGMSD